MSPRRARYRVPFTSERFRIRPGADPRTDTRLTAYLMSARVTIGDVDGSTPIDASLAHFPQLSIAALSVPRVSATWNRDARSGGRAAILLARSGTIDVAGCEGIVLRGESAAVVLPGSTPVTISLRQERSELIYASVPASVLPTGISDVRERIVGSSLSWREVQPLYAFAHSLASFPPSQRDATARGSLLAAPAQVFAATLAALICEDLTIPTTLHARAKEFIAANYMNSNTTLESVASALDAAPRTIQAAFTASGATFSGELRTVRVAAARLVQQKQPGLTSQAVARMVGFTSLSAMYRAFRADEGFRAGDRADTGDVAVIAEEARSVA